MDEKRAEEVELIKRRIYMVMEDSGVDIACYQIAKAISSMSKKSEDLSLDEDSEYDEDIENKYYDENPTVLGLMEQKDLELESLLDALLGNDSQILENIAQKIDEDTEFGFELKNEDIPDLKEEMDEIFGAMYLEYTLRKYGNSVDLQEVLTKKIDEMNYLEFMILLKEYVGNGAFTGNTSYDDCLINKIKQMSIPEFAFFLKESDINRVSTDSSIQKEIKKRVQESKSPYLISQYIMNSTDLSDIDIESVRNSPFALSVLTTLKRTAIHSASVKEYFEKKDEKTTHDENGFNLKLRDSRRLSNMQGKNNEDAIEKEPAYSLYLDVLNGLSQSEFVVYMMCGFDKAHGIYRKEEEIQVDKLKKISDVDLLMIAKKQKVIIGNPEICDKDPILRVAKERGLFDEQYHTTYQPEIELQANKKSNILKEIPIRSGLLSRDKFKDINLKTYNEEFEGDPQVLKLAIMAEEIRNGIMECKSMEELSNLPKENLKDKAQLIRYINMINGNENIRISNEMIEYLQHYISGLPAFIVVGLKLGKNEKINSAIKYKLSESEIVTTEQIIGVPQAPINEKSQATMKARTDSSHEEHEK